MAGPSEVTFLFTDVVGSTALWEAHPDPMSQAMVRHDEVIEGVVGDHDGRLVRPRGEGDSRFAVFDDPAAAIAAAVQIEASLEAEPWPKPVTIVARIAVHTGVADLRAGDYYGSAVNRCARLRAIANPGQVLISDRALAASGGPPPGTTCTDLGRHRLKDLLEPERVHQADRAGAPRSFPPLRSRVAVELDLPEQPTPLIGREREVAEVAQRLEGGARIVTVVGAGGIGKTRVAVAAAAALAHTDLDRIAYVDLVPAEAADDVARAIAAHLGIDDEHGRRLETALGGHLAATPTLLVLDNFEHVIGAADLVAELAEAAPASRFLVTSREPLRLRAEQVVSLDGLPVPAGADVTVAAARAAEAVALFEQAAQRSDPRFVLDDATLAPVLAICRRLDGIPLAIELAAARSRSLGVDALAARLDRSLQVLTGGARDLPARQQTLRATIEWSHDLLGDGERALLRRLGAFAGNPTLTAIDAVCAGPPIDDTWDAAASLVDKHLVRLLPGGGAEPRYGLLETIRAFAREQLEASDEAATFRDRHADHLAARIRALDPNLFGGTASPLDETFLDDLPDARRAIAHRARTDPGDAASLATLAGTAAYRLGPVADGMAILDLVDRGLLTDGSTRGALLVARGIGRYATGDSPGARIDLEEGIAALGVSDHYLAVSGRAHLAFVAAEAGEHERARQIAEDGLALAERSSNPRSRSVALTAGAYAARLAGEQERAVVLCEQAVELAREVGDPATVAYRQADLARALSMAGHHDRAQREARAVVDAASRPPLHGIRSVEQNGLGALGEALTAAGDPLGALPFLARAVALELELTGVSVNSLGWLGLAMALGAVPDDGAVVLGAWSDEAERLAGEPLPEHLLTMARATVGAGFEDGWVRGRADRSAAIDLAIEQLLAPEVEVAPPDG